MVTLVDLLSTTYAPVQTMILPYLGVAEVIALTKTCKGFDQIQHVLKATAYNINWALKRWVSDPVKLRSVQGDCGALIYGSVARKLLSNSASRSIGQTDELFIAVEDAYVYDIEDYLLNDGYTAKPYGRYSRYYGKEIAYDREVKVYLNTSDDRAPIATVFASAYTTASLNFITWNKAYSLFPRTTYIEKDCYLLKELDDEVATHLSSLTKDGLKTKSIAWDQRRGSIGPRAYGGTGYKDKLCRRRRIGDKHTWAQTFDITGVDVPRNSEVEVLETTTYCLRLPLFVQDGPVPNYFLDYDETLRHPVLKFSYVTLKEDEDDGDSDVTDEHGQRIRTSYYSQKCDELKDRLDDLTLMELAKIPAKDRPQQYQRLNTHIDAQDIRGTFDVPDTWTYYDRDVIAFLTKTWKDQLEYDEKEEAEQAKRRLEQVAEVCIGGL